MRASRARYVESSGSQRMRQDMLISRKVARRTCGIRDMGTFRTLGCVFSGENATDSARVRVVTLAAGPTWPPRHGPSATCESAAVEAFLLRQPGRDVDMGNDTR